MKKSNIIKIAYLIQGKEKIIKMDITDLTYYQIISKIIKAYSLTSHYIYHFYYQDTQNQAITLSSQEDFIVSLTQNINIKYYLQQVKQSQFHWLPTKSANQSQGIDPNYAQYYVQQKRKELVDQLQEFKKRTKERVMEQITSKMISIQEQLVSKNKNYTIHRSCHCNACNNNKEIQGDRYRCLVCKQFNLCSECELSQNYKHDENHPFIKIKDEAQNCYLQQKYSQKQQQSKEHKFAIKQSQQEMKFIEFTGSSKQTYCKLKKQYSKATESELIEYYFAPI